MSCARVDIAGTRIDCTWAAASCPSWDHNLLFGNLLDYSEEPDPLGGGSNLFVDPEFLSVEAEDYRLQQGSPAIDAGASLAAPSDDADGTLRPQDGDLDGVAAVDIGAFEALPPPEVASQLDITIDVKPGSDRNLIRPRRGRGVIPVALLGDEDVDVYDVVPDSLSFGVGGARVAHRRGPHFADVNGDEYTDLVAHFRVNESGIESTDEEVCLSGEIAGDSFTACDTIEVRQRSRRWHAILPTISSAKDCRGDRHRRQP